ncbi:hypothetical protein BDW71DRAFT_205545 [Aspergillus fruticulosus]
MFESAPANREIPLPPTQEASFSPALSLHLQRATSWPQGTGTEKGAVSVARVHEHDERDGPSTRVSSRPQSRSKRTITLSAPGSRSNAGEDNDDGSEDGEGGERGSFLAAGSDDEDSAPQHVLWRKLKHWIPPLLDPWFYRHIRSHHINMMVIAVAIVLQCDVSSTGNLEVRVGYFGFCVTSTSINSDEGWICERKAGDLARRIDADWDPLNLLAIADNFKDEVILSVII